MIASAHEGQLREELRRETLTVVAQRYGVAISTAWRWRRDLDAYPRVCGRVPPLPPWSLARQRMLATLTQDWQTMMQLAAALGISRQAVAQTMQRLSAEGLVEYRSSQGHQAEWRRKEDV